MDCNWYLVMLYHVFREGFVCFVHLSGWRWSERVLGALQGGRGALEMQKKCEQIVKKRFPPNVVCRSAMDNIGYLVMF